jgi:hypothetical protein
MPAGSGLGNRDRAFLVATGVRQQVLFDLVSLAGLAQHPQVGAVGRQDEGRDAVFHFLDHHRLGEHAEVLSAVFLGHVYAVEADGLGLGGEPGLDLGRYQRCVGETAFRLAPDHRGFERNQFLPDKARDGVAQHAQFFGQCKVHASLLG